MVPHHETLIVEHCFSSSNHRRHTHYVLDVHASNVINMAVFYRNLYCVLSNRQVAPLAVQFDSERFIGFAGGINRFLTNRLARAIGSKSDRSPQT